MIQLQNCSFDAIKAVIEYPSLNYFQSRYVPNMLVIALPLRRVPLVEQELLTLPEHLSSLPVFSVVRVS